MIDHQNEDVENAIAKIIAKKNFKYSSLDVENFPSAEWARDMTDREKALLTIIIHIDGKRYNQLSLGDHTEYTLLENLSSRFQKMLSEELEKSEINPNRYTLFCSDGKIYYISQQDASNRCAYCSEKGKCAQGCVH
ncbi:MAG: hypothetical protein Q7T50_00015 [Candidatus Magasanikbacteria bacterium]|nr:hypothetical protein [Candidatus Magasanikbacteria bacterium]